MSRTLSQAQMRALRLKAQREKRQIELAERAKRKQPVQVEFKSEPVFIPRKISKPTTIVGTPSPRIVFGAVAKVKAQTVQIKSANRLYRALQVKGERDREWGTVKAEVVHSATPFTQLSEIDRELNLSLSRWQTNGYFGANASFRIATVPAPGSTRTY